jgi:arylsulfatase A-like enzyme
VREVGLEPIDARDTSQRLDRREPHANPVPTGAGLAAARGTSNRGDRERRRNQFLPTVHGFDEFYGNLYHFNSEEGPGDPFERFAFESRMYLRWMADKLWTFLPAQQTSGSSLRAPRHTVAVSLLIADCRCR